MNRMLLYVTLSLLPAAGCGGLSAELRADLENARKMLRKLDISAMTARVSPPECLKPVRDLQGDAAAEYLEALKDYRSQHRPDPESDITAIEPGPGLDPSPFMRFADSEPVRLILQGARRGSCRFTGTHIGIGKAIVDGEVLSLDACVKWVFALAARSVAFEFADRPEEAESALLAALSFGMHMEEDAALANCATGRAVQMQAVFHIEQFFRRRGDRAKAAAAREFGDELSRRGRPWLLLPFLNVLCSDGDAVLEAASIAIASGSLPLACDVAGSVALCRFRNLRESESGPSAKRFLALSDLKKAFPDKVMQEVAEKAESMLVWSPEKIEEFAADRMAGVKRY